MKKELLEKEIISGILVKGDALVEVSQILTELDFSTYRHHYNTLVKSWKANGNFITDLQESGVKAEEISELMDAFYPRPISLACTELKELNTSAEIGRMLQNYARNVPKTDIAPYIAEVQSKLLGAISGSTRESTDISGLIEEFKGRQAEHEERRMSGKEIIGLSTGYGKLDELIDGLRPEHLWIIGGYTNLGKTFAAINIMAELVRSGKRVVFYSLEMSRVDILARLLGILLHENGTSILKGFVDQTLVEKQLEVIRNSNISIHNEKNDLDQILLSMHEETLKAQVDLFVLDFIQLVTVKNSRSEYESTTNAILEFQKASKRFKVPFIVLSQVSNESAKSGEQLVMGFKGTGAIAAAADLAIELVSGEESAKELRTKLNEGQPVSIKWQIRKNRHGRVGFIEMQFTGKTGVFEVYTEEKKNEY